AYEKAEEQRLREARQTALKNQIRVQAQAGAISDAETSLAQLRKILPADAPFIVEAAPRLLAAAYLELASAQARDGNYSNARTLARRGLEYSSGNTELQNAFDEFNRQAERAALFDAVKNATPLTIDKLPGQLQQTQAQFPDEATALKDAFITALAQRIIDLKNYDLVMANALLNNAQQLFPKQQTLQRIELPQPATPSKYVAQGRKALQAGNLSAAQMLLETARVKETGHPQISVFANEVEAAQAQANKYFLAYQQYLNAGNRNQARIYLEAALQQWKDSELFQQEYDSQFTTTRAPERAADGSRPCTPVLAGYGASGRAECYDMVAGQPGPTLVVVPAGGGIKQPYAIGKYEVSVANYNHYCRQTGCAQLPGESGMPATGLSVAQAKSYAAWLTERTGYTYRLPTVAAWLHAAQAEGNAAVSNFNCRVTQGGQILKGLSMLDTRTGEANAWGLVNYVGNAQEWVRAPDGLQARGGHFQDNLSTCAVTLARPHDGSADALTGFRLIREIPGGQ
ncbi:MAG TPA: SUMF1/EgtB/PvdO family nonheme iron enzyme, partial [Gammaproteobacteria bacterium]|nr:SUMF1/EgtB/PvdO family nonheme iron enzyme [Gammaproteobacteria bacterium]